MLGSRRSARRVSSSVTKYESQIDGPWAWPDLPKGLPEAIEGHFGRILNDRIPGFGLTLGKRYPQISETVLSSPYSAAPTSPKIGWEMWRSKEEAQV